MNILTHTASESDYPTKLRAVAYIHTGQDLLPVRFFAATVEEAREMARAHWTATIAKEASKRPRGRPRKTQAIGIKVSSIDFDPPEEFDVI